MEANIAAAKATLDGIRRRPAMYWGDSDSPFTGLVAYLMGIKDGIGLAQERGNSIQFSDLVPDDFHKFVTERFGRQYPDNGMGWMTFIRDHTASEQEAFDLFFEIREEYDRDHAV